LSDVYDVFIAGGGPSGSALARSLARAGLRTLLVERSSPGSGRVCGGFLGPETASAFEALGLPPPPSAPLDTLVLSAPRVNAFERAIPGRAFGVRRDAFDAWLFASAREAGAETLESVSFSGAERDGGLFRVALAARKGERCVRARLVVVATGRRPHAPGGAVSFGSKALYSGVEKIEGRIALHFVRGGNVGLNPVGGGLTALCFYVASSRLRETRGSLDALVEAFARENPSLAAQLGAARREGEWTSCQAEPDGRKILRSETAVHAGDSVSMIHPLVGGGISLALASGVLLAGSIRREGPGERAVRRYAAEWPRRFGPSFRWAGAVGRLRRSERLAALALGLLRSCPAALDPLVRRTRPSG